jgi:hypothetical protein
MLMSTRSRPHSNKETINEMGCSAPSRWHRLPRHRHSRLRLVQWMASRPEMTSAVEQVNYRRCWWHNGHRRCRWVGDSYGYGPGVNLYFGGGGHRGHGHHHRRYTLTLA